MDSKYCYQGTYILKNKLDIHDKDQLLMAETGLRQFGYSSFMRNQYRERLITAIFAEYTAVYFRIYTAGPGKHVW